MSETNYQSSHICCHSRSVSDNIDSVCVVILTTWVTYIILNLYLKDLMLTVLHD